MLSYLFTLFKPQEAILGFKELKEVGFSLPHLLFIEKSKEGFSAVNSVDIILFPMQKINYNPTQYFSAVAYHEIKSLISQIKWGLQTHARQYRDTYTEKKTTR